MYTGHPEAFTPESLQILSDSTNDTSSGTGASSVRIFGLKSPESTEYESEDVILNGTTPVSTVNTWWRVNRAFVLSAGSLGHNEGALTMRATSNNSIVFVRMPATLNQTTIAAYTVPAGSSFLIKRIRAAITKSGGSAATATLSLRVREPSGVFRVSRIFEVQAGAAVNSEEFAGELLPAGTDIKFRVEQASTTNIVCDSSVEYVLVKD